MGVNMIFSLTVSLYGCLNPICFCEVSTLVLSFFWFLDFSDDTELDFVTGFGSATTLSTPLVFDPSE